MDEALERMEKDAATAANAIRLAKDVLIVAHIDADGICSAAIASKTLERLGKSFDVLFVKKIDDNSLREINESIKTLVWVVDLGSGYLSHIKGQNVIVADHHVPDPKWRSGQTSIMDFSTLIHVNPHTYEMDGSREICGSGVTYVISKKVDPNNIDLAYIAVVGAIGDIQDQSECRLIGYNRKILEDAVFNGDVVAEDDIRLFGRETRSLVQLLQFSNDPIIPGLTSHNSECIKFFSDLKMDIKRNGRYISWNSLYDDEKKLVISELRKRIPDNTRLTGEVYTFPKFQTGTEMRDAKEFATLLNSCGRYDDAPVGLRICFGDKDALIDASRNRNEHRKQLSQAMTFVKDNNLIHQRKWIQYLDAGSNIKDTVIGIVAGMLLGSHGVRRDIPLFAFTNADDGVKVSARADRELVTRGLNLSHVVKIAAESVGGLGGGHDIAAGATIPEDKKDEFLRIAEEIVSAQIT